MHPPMIGSITLFPYDFEPEGWKFCDGKVLSIGENDQLFSLLKNNFGGDLEQFTFGLPDLRQSAPRECHYCISLSGFYRMERYEGLIGETMISPTSVNPPNLVECTGQSLPKAQHMLLATYMGTRFGEADGDKFKMPDLRGKAPANCLYVMAVSGSDPMGGSSHTPYVGEIMLLPYEVPAPEQSSWRLCNGDLLSGKQHPAMASLLGNRFGGDGRDTFGLPDLRAAAPSKFNYYISIKGVFPSRS